MTIGGTVLFKKSNNKIIESIILEIFQHIDTTIENLNLKEQTGALTAIFKVTIPPTLSSEYFMNLEDSIIQAPNVLIIKLLGDINEQELYNEISIHEKFGSQDNIMPFCPSYLFTEKIKDKANDIDITDLGASFYDLLQNNSNSKKRLLYDKIKKNYKKQTILIMEFLDCFTLFQFNLFNKKNKAKTPYIHNLYGEEIEFYNYKQINTFYTYFLATLMALENYSHGDLHMGNVLICSDTKLIPEKKSRIFSQFFTALNPPKTPTIIPLKTPTIIPQLIDFGSSALIDRLEFQELNLKDHIQYFSDWKIWADSENQFNFIKNIYDEAKKNQYRIVEYINEKKTKSNYVESILLMSMCLAISKIDRHYNANKDSMFNFTFMIETYNYIGYLHLYKIDENDAKRYNGLIQKLIDKRTIQEQQLKNRMTPYKTSPISRSPRAFSRKSPKASSKASPKASPKASSKASFRTYLNSLLASMRLPATTVKSVRVGGIRKSKGKNTRKNKH